MKKHELKSKQKIKIVYGLVLFVLLCIVFVYGFKLVEIGTAYKAKMLCSEVFVAKRQHQDVLVDLEIDDLAMLKFIKASVNNQAKVASASFLGLITRMARFREDTGCALVFNADNKHVPDETSSIVSSFSSADRDSINELKKSTTGVSTKLVAVLDEAFSEPDPAYLRRTRALVIVHNDRVIAERYAPGVGPDTLLPGWSMTKSILNALVGILVKEGRVTLDAPVLIPEWQSSGDPRASITPNHLLRMTSGLKFNEDMSNPLGDVTRMLLAEPDMAAFAIGKELQHPPGTHWQYSSGNSVILSRAIHNVIGNKEYYRFPRRALFDPIGMASAVLETDTNGTFVASSYMYATAKDWARFGMLYLNNGVWDSKRILPEGWVDYTRTTATGNTKNIYGAHFWLEVPDEYNQTKTALPKDAFHAVGHEGQFVTIIPSYNIVIVRLGKSRYARAWDHGSFVSSVLSAFETAGE